jgi:hypothetical protein
MGKSKKSSVVKSVGSKLKRPKKSKINKSPIKQPSAPAPVPVPNPEAIFDSSPYVSPAPQLSQSLQLNSTPDFSITHDSHQKVHSDYMDIEPLPANGDCEQMPSQDAQQNPAADENPGYDPHHDGLPDDNEPPAAFELITEYAYPPKKDPGAPINKHDQLHNLLGANDKLRDLGYHNLKHHAEKMFKKFSDEDEKWKTAHGKPRQHSPKRTRLHNYLEQVIKDRSTRFKSFERWRWEAQEYGAPKLELDNLEASSDSDAFQKSELVKNKTAQPKLTPIYAVVLTADQVCTPELGMFGLDENTSPKKEEYQDTPSDPENGQWSSHGWKGVN